MTARPLESLFRPRSVAVVGASNREDAIGFRVIRNLRSMGFAGDIHPINPRYDDVAGLPCLPSVSALAKPVDAAFIAIPAAQGPQVLDEIGAHGIRAAFVNASGYADGGAEGRALQARLAEVAKEYGIALCGPNNMGLINVHDKVAMWTQLHMTDVKPGPVAVVSQSGSISLVLAQDERKLGLAYLITAGNEAMLGIADYLQFIVDDARVRTILVFIETIRDPERFGIAADKARSAGKRIIALKTGASERGKSLVAAHTDSLAGDDAIYDAFFRRHGVIRVRDIDEMLETAILVTAYPRPPGKRNVVPVTLSGGEAALIADLAADIGLELQPLSDDTVGRLRPAFPPYAKPQNPLDAWGLGFSVERFSTMLGTLDSDEEVGAVAVSIDSPSGGGADTVYALDIARHYEDSAKRRKPVIFFNNTTGTGPNPEVKAILDNARVPYLSGMRTALAAIGHWIGRPDRDAAEAAPSAAPRSACEPAWRERLTGPAAMRQTALFDLLRDAGVPMTACHAVASADDAIAGAEALGYPVVLKGCAPELAHKTELGLVRFPLHDRASVRGAFKEIGETLRRHAGAGSEIVVQPMVEGGIELIIGLRSDPAFGSIVVVGIGGVFVEFIKSVSLRLGPVDIATAHEMLRECRAAELLAGLRGRGPFDRAAAAQAIEALSHFGAVARGAFSSIEINPLIVCKSGAFGVDALLVPSDAIRHPNS